ncbi:MAG: O-antigen ligase family protein [Janthinobacterium lividum]
MAYIFTLFFIVTAYITPEVLFGPLAQFRIEVILAFLAIVTSLPNLLGARFNEAPQTYAFLGFCIAVPMSILAGGYITGAADVLYGLLPLVLCFLLPAANFRTRQQLQWMTLAMMACSGYFIYSGLQDLYHNVDPSPFLYGAGLRRLRGLGFVFDPNDLGQVLISLVPMVFLGKTRNWFLNIFVLGLPLTLLITGMFFTHSRGAALALMATFIMALRRKVGTVPAVVLGGALFVGALAVGWSGGREVSVEAGGDRLDAWSVGLQFIKQHPMFGVGAGRFAELNDITAHNSVVVCAAELGLPGFVCWVFMIFATLRSGVMITRTTTKSTGDGEGEQEASAFPPLPAASRGGNFRGWSAATAGLGQPAHMRSASKAGNTLGPPPSTRADRAMLLPAQSGGGTLANRNALANSRGMLATPEQQEEIRRLARLLIYSLTGFLVAGWFLSRALSMWLFFYCGAMYAVMQMAEDAGMQPRRDSFGFMLKWSILTAIGLLLAVFGVLKFRALTGG